MTSVLQPWVEKLPFMQQTVLLTVIRGPDGVRKEHITKYMLRWLRRCVLLSALDKEALTTPFDPRGGNFTGPSFPDTSAEKMPTEPDLIRVFAYAPIDWETRMFQIVKDYMKVMDEIPLHFHNHLIDAVKIIGYKHSDERIRKFWNQVYVMLVKDMHLHPETVEELDYRLSDNKEQWQARRVVS